MAITSYSRLGTANTYDGAVRNISLRQSALSDLQANLTAGKKIVRASDDPTGAAQAERSLTRITRITTDQRALESQRNAITVAESTLGDVTDAMQRFRELLVSAGSGIHTSAERTSIATELQGLRDQIFSLANRTDTNGMPLFAGLGSALVPFSGPQSTAPDYTFKGLPGQSASSDVAIPLALDGDSAFMHQPARDQVFNASLSVIPTNRSLSTDAVVVSNTSTVTNTAKLAAAFSPAAQAKDYPSYTLTFGAVTPDATNPLTGPSTTTYTITESPPVTAGFPVTSAPISFVPGSANKIPVVEMPGLSFTITGTPAAGDTVTIASSPSVFSVLDDAINDIGKAPNNNGSSQAVSQALHNIDIGMARVSAVRGQAGDLLNRADRITSNQEQRSIQLESDRSRAEDLDMVKSISEFNNQQTGYSAALQSYAQVQKLSLFNYIG